MEVDGGEEVGVAGDVGGGFGAFELEVEGNFPRLAEEVARFVAEACAVSEVLGIAAGSFERGSVLAEIVFDLGAAGAGLQGGLIFGQGGLEALLVFLFLAG